LLELGDPARTAALHQYCDNPTFPLASRLDVANFLLELHERSCPSVVAEALTQKVLMDVISTIESFYDSAPEQYAELRTLLLNSPNLGVRMSANNAIRLLRDVSAVPALEAAIATEPDSMLRSDMEQTVKDLQNMK
jgi:HEAT repeat protein